MAESPFLPDSWWPAFIPARARFDADSRGQLRDFAAIGNKPIAPGVLDPGRKGAAVARRRSRAEFERVALPHLRASYNLAMWLLAHPQDAEDAVQDAYLRAYGAFDGFHGDHPAAWVLKIVRNTCLTSLKRNAGRGKVVSLDAIMEGSEAHRIVPFLRDKQPLPDANLILKDEQDLVRAAIGQLPLDYREVIVLREFEDMTYQQISEITDVPIGTVMSRLSRARRALSKLLTLGEDGGQRNELC